VSTFLRPYSREQRVPGGSVCRWKFTTRQGGPRAGSKNHPGAHITRGPPHPTSRRQARTSFSFLNSLSQTVNNHVRPRLVGEKYGPRPNEWGLMLMSFDPHSLSLERFVGNRDRGAFPPLHVFRVGKPTRPKHVHVPYSLPFTNQQTSLLQSRNRPPSPSLLDSRKRFPELVDSKERAPNVGAIASSGVFRESAPAHSSPASKHKRTHGLGLSV
jgi:hypothetical protein